MVEVTGFEPATSRPPDERATRLRYTSFCYAVFGVLLCFCLCVSVSVSANLLPRQPVREYATQADVRASDHVTCIC